MTRFSQSRPKHPVEAVFVAIDEQAKRITSGVKNAPYGEEAGRVPHPFEPVSSDENQRIDDIASLQQRFARKGRQVVRNSVPGGSPKQNPATSTMEGYGDSSRPDAMNTTHDYQESAMCDDDGIIYTLEPAESGGSMSAKEESPPAGPANQIAMWKWDLRKDRFEIEGGIWKDTRPMPLKLGEFLLRIDPRERAMFHEKLRRAIEEKNVFSDNVHVIDANGRLRSLSMRGRIGSNGLSTVVSGFCWVNEDVKPLVEETTNDRFPFLEMNRGNVAIADSEGTILAANRQWQTLVADLGSSAEAFSVGVNVFDRCQKAVVEGIRSLRRVSEGVRAVATQKTPEFEHVCRFDLASGIRWIGFRAADFPFQGERLTVLELEDRTAYKRQEIDLRKAQIKGEVAERLKETFVSTLSHEIRTPLSVIIGFTGLLAGEVEETGNPSFKEYYDNIRTATDRLINSVEELLQLSLIKSGAYAMRPEQLSLRDTVAAVAGAFRAKAETKGLHFEILGDTLEDTIFADKQSLERSLTVLIDNAVKYTNKGGVMVKIHSSGNEVCCTVIDTGVGIDENYIDQAFHDFTQEGTGLTRPYDGLGIGLSLAKIFTELNGGSIELKSEKWVGTSAAIRLPKFDPHAEGVKQVEEVQELTAETRAFSSEHSVLIVSNDPLVKKLYSHLLLNKTMAVFCTDFEMVQMQVRAGNASLVLIDSTVEKKGDGLALLRKLKEDESRAAVPVFYMSAHPSDAEIEEALIHGCEEFLIKPLRAEQLRGLFHRYLSLNETRGEEKNSIWKR